MSRPPDDTAAAKLRRLARGRDELADLADTITPGGCLAGSVIVGTGTHRSSEIPWIAVAGDAGSICFYHRSDLSVELGVVATEELGRPWSGGQWTIEDLALGSSTRSSTRFRRPRAS